MLHFPPIFWIRINHSLRTGRIKCKLGYAELHKPAPGFGPGETVGPLFLFSHRDFSYPGAGESWRGKQQERDPPGCPRHRHHPVHGGSQHPHLQPPRLGGDRGGGAVRQTLPSSSLDLLSQGSVFLTFSTLLFTSHHLLMDPGCLVENNKYGDFIVRIFRLRACLSYRGDWTGQQELLNREHNCHLGQQNIGDSPHWCSWGRGQYIKFIFSPNIISTVLNFLMTDATSSWSTTRYKWVENSHPTFIWASSRSFS